MVLEGFNCPTLTNTLKTHTHKPMGLPIPTLYPIGLQYFPRETPENHAHENNGDAPDICLAWTIGLPGQDFGCKVGIGAHYAYRGYSHLSGIEKASGCPKVNEHYNVMTQLGPSTNLERGAQKHFAAQKSHTLSNSQTRPT